MRRVVRLCMVAAVALSVWFGHTERVSAKPTPEAAASKNLLKKAKSHIAYFRSQEKATFERLCDAIDAIDAGIRSGEINVFTGLGLLNLAIEAAFLELEQVARTVNSTMIANESEILGPLGDLGMRFRIRGSLAGDCGALEYIEDNLENEYENFVDDVRAKLKEFGVKQLVSEDQAMTAKVEPPVVHDVVPYVAPETPPAVAPFKPLRFEALGGASNTTRDADGRLCVSGTADPRNGGTVTVVVRGPDGKTYNASSPVNQTTCRWRICVPPSGEEGTLTEGNYQIDATQGGVTLSGSIGVP